MVPFGITIRKITEAFGISSEAAQIIAFVLLGFMILLVTGMMIHHYKERKTNRTYILDYYRFQGWRDDALQALECELKQSMPEDLRFIRTYISKVHTKGMYASCPIMSKSEDRCVLFQEMNQQVLNRSRKG